MEEEKRPLDRVRELPWTTLLSLAIVLVGVIIYFLLGRKIVGLVMILGGVVAYVVFNTPWFKNLQACAKRNRMTDEKKRAEYKGVVTTRRVIETRLPVIDKELKNKTRYMISGTVSGRLKKVVSVKKDKDTETKFVIEKLVKTKKEDFEIEVSADLWNNLPEKSEVRLKAIQFLSLDEEEIAFDWRKVEPYEPIRRPLDSTKAPKKAETEAKAAKSNPQTGVPAKAGANP